MQFVVSGTEHLMVECELMTECRKFRWYHLDCLKVSCADELPGKEEIQCVALKIPACYNSSLPSHSPKIIRTQQHHEITGNAIQISY
jgi:hypothetical protein